MEIKKYAAIDIGSNAMRLLVANVIIEKGKETQFRKSALVRAPIRLGQDAFVEGRISEKNKLRMVDAIHAFKLLMKVHGVEKFKACATSAIRESSNGETVVQYVKDNTDVEIDIIDGKKEAAIIFATDLHDIINKDYSYLYIDVGGGSTEFTIFSKGKIVTSKSFKMGTVRLLNNTKEQNDAMFKELEVWIRENTREIKPISVIGSGGNINKIFKMSGRKMGTPLSFIYLEAQYRFLNKLTYEQRISELGLNPDRSDVIVPATKIYLSAMKWSEARKIYVPKIGLSDGIIESMHLGKLSYQVLD